MISHDKSPVSEIDVRFIQTIPFFLCTEMCFELIKYIPLEKCFEKFLLIKQINERLYLLPLPRDDRTHAEWMGIHKTELIL